MRNTQIGRNDGICKNDMLRSFNLNHLHRFNAYYNEANCKNFIFKFENYGRKRLKFGHKTSEISNLQFNLNKYSMKY